MQSQTKKAEKISVSLPAKLREDFDARIVKPNYSSRSTEIRRLMAESVQGASLIPLR
jgi:metal-responsive CopG/Arc/MetJ family transcriptional regulator